MDFKKWILLLLLIPALRVSAQEGEQKYVPDPDPLIQRRIDQWQDLKFGLLMHWGPYSQWGIVESWSICPEDEGWCVPDTVKDYFTYKKRYEGLGKTFNPVKFDPERWAKAARDAGMKYVVFTTKHHDGFCMFDSKYTEYKITGKDSPFRTNSKADVSKAIFSAFRDQGFWIGAYFSKPDWHSPDYWWPQFPPLDRNVNYDPERYPERWNSFVNYTHNQVMELCSNYGKIDLFWFDGGWVHKLDEPKGNTPEIPGYSVKKRYNQDIKMDDLVSEIRTKQPEAIVVDRAVPGKNQNYLTPENTVPDKMLPYPWESCIILGGGWSYSFNARMMPTVKVIHLLSDIVAKGGNLLLNIGPGPDGTWYDEAYLRLKEVGEWLRANGEAIYSTRPVAPYYDGKLRFTRAKDGSVYVILLLDDNEKLPPEINVKGITPAKGAKVTMLDPAGMKLRWKTGNDGFTLSFPSGSGSLSKLKYAVAVKIDKVVVR
jgi:alpha-L-fucosidase